MERRITKYMKSKLEEIKQIKKLIKDADYILIGAGAGLSTAAGIEYTGKRFEDNFTEFIEKYHFTDMYSSGFYDFKTEEEKWAYWAKHMYMNCIGMSATKLYEDIFKLVKDKNYFVITTNVDEQFYKSGFDKEKIFATQGSYRYIRV
jgi:NAD-dependent SIR2 family protein deacetylase